MRHFKIYPFFSLILLITACSSKLDFDQAEQFRTLQKWEGSIFRVETEGHRFYINGIPLQSISDTTDFKLFKPADVKKAFVKLELETYCENHLDATFRINISYLSDSTLLHQTQITVPDGYYRHTLFETIDSTHTPPFTDIQKIAVEIQRSDLNDIQNSQEKLIFGVNGILYTEAK